MAFRLAEINKGVHCYTYESKHTFLLSFLLQVNGTSMNLSVGRPCLFVSYFFVCISLFICLSDLKKVYVKFPFTLSYRL